MTLYVYVDNSNIWIEGQRLQAVRTGLAPTSAPRWIGGSPRRGPTTSVASTACSAHPVWLSAGPSFSGPRPPDDDSIWQRVRDADFQVVTFDRSPFTHKEKQVDVALSTAMMEDSFKYMKAFNGDMAVLAAGDAYFLPTIGSLQACGLRVRVASWCHAVNRRLRDTADEFVELDPYFDYLTWSTAAWRDLPGTQAGVSRSDASHRKS